VPQPFHPAAVIHEPHQLCRKIAGIVGAEDDPGLTVVNQLGQAADVTADADFSERHRLERLERRDPLVDDGTHPGIDEDIHDRIPGRHVGVGHVAGEHHACQTRSLGLGLKHFPLRSLADDHEAHVPALGAADGQRRQQRGEPLQPANRSDESEHEAAVDASGARARGVSQAGDESRAVDAVRHDLELARRDAAADQLGADPAGDRHDQVGAAHRAELELPDQPMFQGVVAQPVLDHGRLAPERPHLVDQRDTEPPRRGERGVRVCVRRMGVDHVRPFALRDVEHRSPIAGEHHRASAVRPELRFRRCRRGNVVRAVIGHAIEVFERHRRILRGEDRTRHHGRFESGPLLKVDDGASTNRVAPGVGDRTFEHMKHFHVKPLPVQEPIRLRAFRGRC
jgi:hypothetical protein